MARRCSYIQTDASDPSVAKAQDVSYVPGLAGAANSSFVDDIYVVTNFKQYNVIASEPHPIGPQNIVPNYTPLWQVSDVHGIKALCPCIGFGSGHSHCRFKRRTDRQ